jgi:periplasmic divalent cation tolerance protein
MKTTAKCLAELEREVLRLHSYDVPEFIVLPISAGSGKYLAWINDSVKE